MSTDTDLRDLLSHYADAKNRHDIDAVVAAYAPDGRYEGSGLAEPIVGHHHLRKFYEALFTAIPDYQGHFDGTALGEDTAVVWGRMTGTVGADLLGLPTRAGSRIDVPVTFVCRFRDGLLFSDCGYFDSRILDEQAGLQRSENNAPAASFVAQWARFWAAPGDEANSVHPLIADDVVMHWPGSAEPLHGREAYAAQLAAAVGRIPDLTLSVVDYAHRGDLLIITWLGRGTIDGTVRQWRGADQFRLCGGRSAETTVVFDTWQVASGGNRPSAR